MEENVEIKPAPKFTRQHRTFSAKPAEVQRKWYVVDATDKVVGRLASEIAMILMGKNKPSYTPHVDCGDYVIVTNVDKVVFTGNKWDGKRYTWTTGYTRLRSESAAERFAKHPEMILHEAVREERSLLRVEKLTDFLRVDRPAFRSPAQISLQVS